MSWSLQIYSPLYTPLVLPITIQEECEPYQLLKLYQPTAVDWTFSYSMAWKHNYTARYYNI